ncbi:hypothetical protein K1514_01120 [Paraclostridium bifermentans]|uniref:DUF5667 domain-containing protein n=1 Tax=Paraclostridium bifermentans TaxID=1490 RepID=A0AA44IHL9_PARBF|nr:MULTISPECIES: hypothetical protein [Paraclostridium]MBN8047415.1 hypothetical protein [Paraclostridium bifermentans]MBZ6004480.1 hypothetical protein [Paraclostridium bifermentans]MDU0296371.1 hypothetical protein [Paraclostridium sp. MRS3W1]NME09982.1 hypothetical protein [Paraclostridium bifermentans]
MLLKKFSIFIFITLILFTINMNFSYSLNPIPTNSTINLPVNPYIKELEIIDNHMYILIKSIVRVDLNKKHKKNEVINQIKFIETSINDLTLKTSHLTKKDADAILAMQSILNYYKISIIQLKSYLKDNDSDNLINSITSFSIGYNLSGSLRSVISKVK